MVYQFDFVNLLVFANTLEDINNNFLVLLDFYSHNTNNLLYQEYYIIQHYLLAKNNHAYNNIQGNLFQSSSILQVEIVDRRGKVVGERIFRHANRRGRGENALGSVILPGSGAYTLKETEKGGAP